MRYLGCAYYPEGCDMDRVAHDIRLMRAAGMNMARLGEFAWSKMERRAGEFDFSLFKKTLEMLAENGIDALMCTPTATPPAWLTHKHPETLVSDVVGHRAIHGIRQQCCYNSKKFRELSLRIVEEEARSLRDCKNIAAWQIDNELGQRLHGACSCGECQASFREFLRARYGTIDNLNFRWKNEFWSQDYSDWDEITLAFPECLWNKSPQVIHTNYSVSRALDSMRFYDKIVADYANLQADAIRRIIPDAKITTNNPAGIFDLNLIYENLDFAAGDFYWNNRRPADMARRLSGYRSVKGRRFFVAETGTSEGYEGVARREKAMRLDMWRSFAHGSDSYLFFRWDPPLGGQEQTVAGLVSPSGRPGRNHAIAQRLFAEVAELRGELDGISLPRAEVAMVFDSDVEKSYERHAHGHTVKHMRLVNEIFSQLHRRNIAVNFVSPDEPLDGHRLLILPSQRITRKGLSERVRDFVKSGGVAWSVGELNTADDNSNYTRAECPELLTDVFGVVIDTGMSVFPVEGMEKTRVSGSINGKSPGSVLGPSWIADMRKNDGVESLLKFDNGFYDGQPAMTCNSFGKGLAICQGVTGTGPELLSEIAGFVLEKAGVKSPTDCPEGVEIIDCGKAVFVLNPGDSKATFKLPLNASALRGKFDAATGTVSVDAMDMCILKRIG